MPSVTRSTLRNDVRQDLSSWPDFGELSADVDAKSQTLQITEELSRSFMKAGVLLEIGTEVLKVIDVPEGGTSVRVMRGYYGSTAAAHSKLDAVKIYAAWGFTDFELNNRIIPQAIQFLKPFAWTIAVSSDFTWTADKLQATAPSGVSYPDGNFIIRLENKDANGDYHPFYGWKLIGSILRFNSKAGAARTLRAHIAQFQASLTDDTTTLDNDSFREAIVKYAVHLALNSLKANRIRYSEYSAALDDRASTPDELIRVAFDFKNQAVVSREENGRPWPAGFASTYKGDE